MELAVEAPLFEDGAGLDQGHVVFLGIKPAHMQQADGIVQGVVILFDAPAQIDAVGHQRDVSLLQAVKLRHGLPDLPGQGHRQGLFTPEQMLSDLPVQKHRFLLRLVVDRMDNGHPGSGQRHIFKRVKMGVDDLGLLLPDQGLQLADAAKAGAQGLIQVAHRHPCRLQPFCQRGTVPGKAHRRYLMAHAVELHAQPLAHGFRPAHTKGGDHLQNFHKLPPY